MVVLTIKLKNKLGNMGKVPRSFLLMIIVMIIFVFSISVSLGVGTPIISDDFSGSVLDSASFFTYSSSPEVIPILSNGEFMVASINSESDFVFKVNHNLIEDKNFSMKFIFTQADMATVHDHIDIVFVDENTCLTCRSGTSLLLDDAFFTRLFQFSIDKESGAAEHKIRIDLVREGSVWTADVFYQDMFLRSVDVSGFIGSSELHVAVLAYATGGGGSWIYKLTQFDLSSLAEADSDNDGILDGIDNCPSDFNPGQEDTDNDNLGDVCYTDDDNDNVPDTNDVCSNSVFDDAPAENHYSWLGGLFFKTKNAQTKEIVDSSYTIASSGGTGGCTCAQILDKLTGKPANAGDRTCTKIAIDNFVSLRSLVCLA